MAMKLEIIFQGYNDTHGAIYEVIVDDLIIETWVTHSAPKVEKWIRWIEHWNQQRLHRLIVGLDIEWCPNTVRGQDNPVAILQLNVNRSCLIYQFNKGQKIPDDLKNFLKNPSYTFVGVGIEDDKKKLYKDHSVELGKTVDLRQMATHELTDDDHSRTGLKKLAKLILGKDVGNEGLMKVRMSDWDKEILSNEQVLYACLDAHLSFAIGRQLQSWYD